MKSFKKIKNFLDKLVKINNVIRSDDENIIDKVNFPNYILDTLDEISLFSFRCALNAKEYTDIYTFLNTSLLKICTRYIKVYDEDLEYVMSFIGANILNAIEEHRHFDPETVLNAFIEALSDIKPNENAN